MGVSIPNSALETSSLIKYITFLTIRDLGIVSGMSMKQQINCIRANRYVSIERYVTVHLAPAIDCTHAFDAGMVHIDQQ